MSLGRHTYGDDLLCETPPYRVSPSCNEAPVVGYISGCQTIVTPRYFSQLISVRRRVTVINTFSLGGTTP